MLLETSYCVLDAKGRVIDARDADRVHSTASIGKIFLLCEAAERISSGQIDPQQPLVCHPDDRVADSGIWQHLLQERLPLADLCLLIGAVSDNRATNALLGLIGLDAVQGRARALGCAQSTLLDRVRDERLPHDPSRLSIGTAGELAEVARRIHVAAAADIGGTGEQVAGITPAAAALVERWLLSGVDLSLVGAPFFLDPLAHVTGDVRLWSKTGCDDEVRADVGVAWCAPSVRAYAALASWPEGAGLEAESVQWMNALGRTLAADLRA